MDKMNNSEKKEHGKSSSKTIEQKLEAMGMEDYEIFLKRAYGSKDPDVCNDTDQEQEHTLLLDELQRQVTVKDDISKTKPLDQESRKQTTHHASNTSTFSTPYDVKSSTSPLTSSGYRSFASYGVDNKSVNLNNNVRTLNGGGGVTTITSNSLISSCSSSCSSSSNSHSANNNYSSSGDEQATRAFENDLQNNAYFTNEVSEVSGNPYIRANLDSPPDTSSFHRPTTPTLHSYPFQLGDGKNVSSLLTNDRSTSVQSQNSSQLGLVDLAAANGTGRGPDGCGGSGVHGASYNFGGHGTDRFAKRNERFEKAQKKKHSKAQLKETVVKPEEMPGYKGEETLESLLKYLEGEDASEKGKKKDGGKKKDNRGKEKDALVKSASLDESHLNSNKKRSVASESSVAAGSSSSVAATPSSAAPTPIASLKSHEKKKSSQEPVLANTSLPKEVGSPSLVQKNHVVSSESGASVTSRVTNASPLSGVLVNGVGNSQPSANGKNNNFKKPCTVEGLNGNFSAHEDERCGRDDIFEAPFELVQNKKKKPRKTTSQRESAETFSRRSANEHARREQAKARRSIADRRKSVGSVPGSENEASDDDSVRSLPAVQCLNLLIMSKSEQHRQFIQQSPRELIVAVANVETADETTSTGSNPTSSNSVGAAIPNGTADEVVLPPDSNRNPTNRPRNASMSSGGGTDMPVIFCGNNFEREIPVAREDLGFEFGFFDGMRGSSEKAEDSTPSPMENMVEGDASAESLAETSSVGGCDNNRESTPDESGESPQQYEDGAGGDGLMEDVPAHEGVPSGKTEIESMSNPGRGGGDKSVSSRGGRDSLLGTYTGPPVHSVRRGTQNSQYLRGSRGGLSSGQAYRGQNRNGSATNPPVIMYPHFVPNASQPHMQPNAVAYAPHHPMMQIPSYPGNVPPPQAFAPAGPPPYGHPHAAGAHPQRGLTMVQPAGFIPPMMYSMHPSSNPPMLHPPSDDGSIGGIPTAPHLMNTAQLQAGRFLVNPQNPQPPSGIEGIPVAASPMNDAEGYPMQQYQLQPMNLMMPVPNALSPLPMMYCAPTPAIHVPTSASEIESWMNSQVQRAYNLEQQGQLQIHRLND